MRRAASDHIAAGQELQKLQVRPLVENTDGRDGKVDAVGIERVAQVGKVSIALIYPHLWVRVLEFGDHAGDQRVGEERRATNAHHAGTSMTEIGDELGRLA